MGDDSMFAETISITVCGDGGTGKSSISLRLVRCKWTHEYDPTIQDFYSVTRVVDGKSYQLQLTDTAGQEEYRGLWAASNLNSDAYLLVYDITSKDSLEALNYFDELINIESEMREQPFPPVKIVAGNKVDLARSRQVSAAEGLAWARDHGCGFMETSARNMVNIEETFQLLVRRVVAAREAAKSGQPQPSPPQPLGSQDEKKGSNKKNRLSGISEKSGQSKSGKSSNEKLGKKKNFNKRKFGCAGCTIC